MSTSDIQARHNVLIARLVLWASENGYKLTQGDAYRDPRGHGKKGQGSGCAGYSSSNSQHKDRMACDFNLFIESDIGSDGFPVGGQYAQDSAAYKPLGVYWESLHPACRWGGRFNDGNHFETKPSYDNREDTPL